MDKYELARQLSEISSYEEGFRKQSFEKASMIIMGMSEDDFVTTEPSKFKDIRGIGPSIAKCIEEYILTGKITRLENHRNSGKIPTRHFYE